MSKRSSCSAKAESCLLGTSPLCRVSRARSHSVFVIARSREPRHAFARSGSFAFRKQNTRVDMQYIWPLLPDKWWSHRIPQVDVPEPQRRQVHRGHTAHGIDKFFQLDYSAFSTHLSWVWLWFRSFFSCFMQGVLGELSPQKPNFGDKIQCLQRFADLVLPPSFHIFVINKPYRKRRFCPAYFLNFCKTKKPLHMCGKKKGHKDSYAVL